MTSYTITLPELPFEKECELMKWTKKNCKSLITTDGCFIDDVAYITYYFYNEKDANWFTLRWS